MNLASFIQGKTIHELGEYSASQAAEHASLEIWGKSFIER